MNIAYFNLKHVLKLSFSIMDISGKINEGLSAI